MPPAEVPYTALTIRQLRTGSTGSSRTRGRNPASARDGRKPRATRRTWYAACWHPAVEYAVQRVIVPGYAEFVSGLPSFPLQEIAGIPVTRDAAAEPGAWELASGENPIASGTVRWA